MRESRSIDTQLSERQDGLDYKVLAIATNGTCEREEAPDNPLNLANSKGLRTVCLLHYVQCAMHPPCLHQLPLLFCSLTATFTAFT